MRHGVKRQFEEYMHKEARSVVLLNDGFTNENFLINDAYVFRIIKKDRDPSLSFKLEYEIYKMIEPLNISEKIKFFNENNGDKISGFVHNSRFYNPTPNNEQILYLVRALKKLHNSGLDCKVYYDPFKKLTIYKKGLEENLLLDQKYEKAIIKEYKAKFNKEELVLSHNDLVKGNLLFKYNGLTIIDWECASMNIAYFDLASFISENNLKEDQIDYFLKKYFGYKYTNIKRKKVDLVARFQDILFYYWALYYYKKRGDEIYFSIAIDKLNRIKDQMILLKFY